MTKENLYRDYILRNENEAAHFLNVSKQTLIRLRKSGQIGYYRIGRRVLYGQEHLENYLSGANQQQVCSENFVEAGEQK